MSPRRVPDSLVLAVACLGQFMVVLDVSVVNVALPAIRTDLGFSPTGLQWVVNAYTIVFAGFLLLGGRAADLFGQRRLFLLGLGLFTAASLGGGLAQTSGQLLVARAVQGLGGAVLSPATLTVLTTTFREPARRARALGVWSAVAGAGGAAGALAGGVLTDLLSWRWILFVNIPVGVVGLVAARLVLAEGTHHEGERRVDVLGAVLATGGLVALVTGIVESDSRGWGSAATWGPFAGGLVLLAVFAVAQARLVAVHLVPLRLFRSRSVSTANAVMFFLASATFAAWYFLSLYLQGTQGFTPLGAGLVFLPQTLAIIAGAQVSSRVVGRVGARPLLVVGGLTTAVGLLLLARVPLHETYATDLLVPSVLTTLGIGLGFTPVALSATHGVARADAGLASGLVNTTRQVGGSLGLAVLATIAVDHTKALVATRGQVAAQVAGYHRAFAVAAVFAVLSAGVALLLRPAQAPAPSDAGTTAPEVDGYAEEPGARVVEPATA